MAFLSAKDVDPLLLGEGLIQKQVQEPLALQQRSMQMYSRVALAPPILTWRGKIQADLVSFEVSTREGLVLLGIYNQKERNLLLFDAEKNSFVKPEQHPRLNEPRLQMLPRSET